MVRRIGIAALWFLAAWTAGAMFALVLGLGTWVAPVVAITAAAGIFWALGRVRPAREVADRQPAGVPSLEA